MRTFRSCLSRLSLAAGCAAALAACGDSSTSSTANTGAAGASAGGSNTGGSNTGGSATGGSNTGGSATGGSNTGGTMTGGAAGSMASGGSTPTGGAGGTTTTSIPPTDPCPPDPSGPVPPLKLTQVATGLEYPLFVTAAPGDTSRLFVLEQNGRIRVIKNGALLATPFLDIGGLVQHVTFDADERGLLGLAFHPDYANNGRFFVHYTDAAENHGTIVEYHATPGTDAGDPASAKILFTVTDTQYGNHNGGMLAYGPDGYLYMGFGDGGKSDDPDGNGQNINSQLGKIHRIDPDTFPTPVPGNLQGGYPHLWDYGLRNPWRFSFDRCTGDLYIGDVGQNAWEEIDVEPKGQGLKNYGWDVVEGNHCHEPANGCDMSGFVPPVTEYSHASGGGCSVSGGYVYRGYNIPNLVGTYLYGDYCSKKVLSFRYAGGAATEAADLTMDLETDMLDTISSFGQDELGELYIVDLSGSVYRIDPE